MALRGPQAVELGLARLSDSRALALISRRYVENGLPWRWRTAAIFQHVRSEDSSVVVARDGKRIVGFALMSFDFTERDAHLLLLGVVPSHRRAGLGSRLFEWLEVIARRGGIERIRLEVRATAEAAQHLYRARGFETLSRLPDYYQGREDALRLQKRLD
ncbi:MAG: GNAT family N-acetyltransferase [Myxococcota bacterium]|nr:GNAT family N-acetyltransferase [Myxococcota bacterium]